MRPVALESQDRRGSHSRSRFDRDRCVDGHRTFVKSSAAAKETGTQVEDWLFSRRPKGASLGAR